MSEGRVPAPPGMPVPVLPPQPDAAAVDVPPEWMSEVSAEMVLGLAEERLGDMDDQVRRQTEGIVADTNRAEELSQDLEVLQRIQAVATAQGGDNPKIEYDPDGSGSEDPDYTIIVDGETYHSVKNLAEAHGLDDELEGLVKKGKIKASALNDLTESIRQELESINSGNELKMLNLQQAMQRRAQVLELASNLIRQLHQANEAIIRNLGV